MEEAMISMTVSDLPLETFAKLVKFIKSRRNIVEGSRCRGSFGVTEEGGTTFHKGGYIPLRADLVRETFARIKDTRYHDDKGEKVVDVTLELLDSVEAQEAETGMLVGRTYLMSVPQLYFRDLLRVLGKYPRNSEFVSLGLKDLGSH